MTTTRSLLAATARWGMTVLLLPLLGLGQGVCMPCRAQEVTDGAWDDFVQQWSEEHEDDGSSVLEDEMAQLLWLHEHPLDLRVVTDEALHALPFLTPEGVASLAAFGQRHGFRSVADLLLVPGLTLSERRWLRLFVTVGDEDETTSGQGRRATPTIDSKVHHELQTRLDIPLYNRAGWDWRQGMAHRVRYVGSVQRGQTTWEWGLRADKDAGEEMFTRKRPLWDAHGGFVRLQVGERWHIVVGDYKASFGEGLVLNNGFSMGKLSTLGLPTAGGFKPHRSYDESNFLRGAAASVHLGRWVDISALYSFRQLDASVSDTGTVATIVTDGLHRTETEVARRRSTNAHTAALNVRVGDDVWHVGLTGMYHFLGRHFEQRGSSGTASPYRQIYPRGNQFGALSLDYGLRLFPFYLNGETARSMAATPTLAGTQGGWATLNRLLWRMGTNTSLTVVQRYYSKGYYSPWASAFGEGSRVQNENGVAVIVDADRLGSFGLQAMADYFYNVWPRYTMSRSSWGWEGALQGTWQPRRGRLLLLRYTVKSKESSDQRHYTHRLKAQYAHTFSPHWSMRLLAQGSAYRQPSAGSVSWGWTVFPRVDYASGHWGVALAAGLFCADDYNTRLFVYEPTVTQGFGIQMLYGRGGRAAAVLKWTSPSRRLRLQGKVGATHYTDRDAISTSTPYLTISSSWKVDVQLLLVWKM